MNQVAHKVVPVVATNNRMVLKPSEKVPLSALLLRRPPLRSRPAAARCSSVVTGDPREIADELITNARRRPRHLHRRRRDRQVHRRQGGLPAHRARARRQRPDHRDGRRRPRRGLDARGAGLVQELGPALHRGQADAGARGGRRRFTERVVAKTKAWTLRRPGRPQRRHGHRHRRGRGAPVRGARQRGGRAGRAPARRQPARRRALFADRARPRAARDDAGARGDLRPGLADHPLRRHRRGDPRSPTAPPTACRRRCAPTGSTTSPASSPS